MAVIKVLELIAKSPESWEAATQKAIDEAAKSVKNIDSVYVKEFKADVKDNKISDYVVIVKVSFRVE